MQSESGNLCQHSTGGTFISRSFGTKKIPCRYHLTGDTLSAEPAGFGYVMDPGISHKVTPV